MHGGDDIYGIHVANFRLDYLSSVVARYVDGFQRLQVRIPLWPGKFFSLLSVVDTQSSII